MEIIPQIILSGIIVKYDNLNPAMSSPKNIPWYGEMIMARWTYEALAVYQFKNNKYQEPVFEVEGQRQRANYKKDIWLNEIENRLVFYESNINDNSKKDKIKKAIKLIKNELNKEINKNKSIIFTGELKNFDINNFGKKDIKKVREYLSKIKKYYIKKFNKADNKKDSYLAKRMKTDSLKNEYYNLMNHNANKRLERMVTNKDQLQAVIEYDGELVQKSYPIYRYPDTNIKAHFYAPKKNFFGRYYDTFWFNMAIMWLGTFILYIALLGNWLKNLFLHFENLKFRKHAK